VRLVSWFGWPSTVNITSIAIFLMWISKEDLVEINSFIFNSAALVVNAVILCYAISISVIIHIIISFVW